MYFNKDNNFFHGIMFHHFHDDGIHTKGQGSISRDDFYNLIKFIESGIKLTEFGRDFVQNIMNVFDNYDPPNKSYSERLEIVKKAKLAQAKVQESI